MMLKKDTCCDLPFSPQWERETDGDFVFVSTCPKCQKRTECQPNGRDMQTLHRLAANSPPVPPKPTPAVEEPVVTAEEQADAALAIKLYSDFKWWARMMNRTHAELAEKLEECAVKASDGMKTPQIREEAVARFRMMATRLSEFTVSDETPGTASEPLAGEP